MSYETTCKETNTAKPLINFYLKNDSCENEDASAMISNDSIDTGDVGRRVSFPKCDSQLVTGYLEPANPWESVSSVKSISELTEIYTTSCKKHKTEPFECILNHLQTIDLNKNNRLALFALKNNKLSPDDCETLEEIFKRVQYESLDFSSCELNELSAPGLFDIIEYYEAATELDISNNPAISIRGWQSCICMIRKSHALQVLTACGNPLSEANSASLGKALNSSSLHTIKLEHCGLQGKPINNLCTGLKKNQTLKELWLGFNDLSAKDAHNLAELLRQNAYIQFLDISNNTVKDSGVKALASAIIEQSLNIELKTIDDNKSDFWRLSNNSSDLDYSYNTITPNYNNKIQQNGNSGRSMLDQLLRIHPKTDPEIIPTTPEDERKTFPTLIFDNSKNSLYDNISKFQQALLLQNDYHRGINNDKPSIQLVCDNSIVENKPQQSAAVNVNNKNNDETKLDDDDDDLNSQSADSAFESSSEDDKNKQQKNPILITVATTGQFMPPPTPPTASSKIKNLSPDLLSRLAYDKISEFNIKICQDSGNSEPPQERLRSHSTDSLSSDTSLDGSDSSSTSSQQTFSRNVREQLAKNDTLTRQKPNIETYPIQLNKPRGLRALILWNNNLSRESGEYIADMLKITQSLELLNIGKNCLSNEFVIKIRDSLLDNLTLTNLGLQAAHLSCDGIRALAKVLQFGGNCTLQRIDIRDNHIQVDCLNILADALKSNKTVTRVDIDDVPKRITDSAGDLQFHYSRALNNVRSLCSGNEKSQNEILTTTTNNKKCENPKLRHGYFNSRKISLTCQSITNNNVLEKSSSSTNNSSTTSSSSTNNSTGLSQNNSITTTTNNKLDAKRKTGIRLRSPLPSPPTISPSTSPVPSPSKSRFQVFRVIDDNPSSPTSPNNLSPTANNICNTTFNTTITTNNTTLPLSPLISSSTSNQIFGIKNTKTNSNKSRFRVTKVENSDVNSLLNYHSMDASNNINVNSIKEKCFNKSKSLPDISCDSTNNTTSSTTQVQNDIDTTTVTTTNVKLKIIEDDDENLIKSSCDKENYLPSNNATMCDITKNLNDFENPIQNINLITDKTVLNDKNLILKNENFNNRLENFDNKNQNIKTTALNSLLLLNQNILDLNETPNIDQNIDLKSQICDQQTSSLAQNDKKQLNLDFNNQTDSITDKELLINKDSEYLNEIDQKFNKYKQKILQQLNMLENDETENSLSKNLENIIINDSTSDQSSNVDQTNQNNQKVFNIEQNPFNINNTNKPIFDESSSFSENIENQQSRFSGGDNNFEDLNKEYLLKTNIDEMNQIDNYCDSIRQSNYKPNNNLNNSSYNDKSLQHINENIQNSSLVINQNSEIDNKNCYAIINKEDALDVTQNNLIFNQTDSEGNQNDFIDSDSAVDMSESIINNQYSPIKELNNFESYSQIQESNIDDDFKSCTVINSTLLQLDQNNDDSIDTQIDLMLNQTDSVIDKTDSVIDDSILLQTNPSIVIENESSSESSAEQLEDSTQQQQKYTHSSAVEKLLSLFNPGEFLSRVTTCTPTASTVAITPDIDMTQSNENNITTTVTTNITNNATTTASNSQCLVPLRKPSPPNLFSWYKLKGNDSITSKQCSLTSSQTICTTGIGTHTTTDSYTSTSDNSVSNNKNSGSFFDVATKQFKDFADFGKQIFKHNINFVTIVSATAAAASASNQQPILTTATTNNTDTTIDSTAGINTIIADASSTTNYNLDINSCSNNSTQSSYTTNIDVNYKNFTIKQDQDEIIIKNSLKTNNSSSSILITNNKAILSPSLVYSSVVDKLSYTTPQSLVAAPNTTNLSFDDATTLMTNSSVNNQNVILQSQSSQNTDSLKKDCIENITAKFEGNIANQNIGE